MSYQKYVCFRISSLSKDFLLLLIILRGRLLPGWRSELLVFVIIVVIIVVVSIVVVVVVVNLERNVNKKSGRKRTLLVVVASLEIFFPASDPSDPRVFGLRASLLAHLEV